MPPASSPKPGSAVALTCELPARRVTAMVTLLHVRTWRKETYECKTGGPLLTRSGCRRSKLFALRDASLLDHLVRGRQQRFRNAKAERLGGLEIDDEFELSRLPHRQIGGFAPPSSPVARSCSAAV